LATYLEYEGFRPGSDKTPLGRIQFTLGCVEVFGKPKTMYEMSRSYIIKDNIR
jgi:hypothetical protein